MKIICGLSLAVILVIAFSSCSKKPEARALTEHAANRDSSETAQQRMATSQDADTSGKPTKAVEGEDQKEPKKTRNPAKEKGDVSGDTNPGREELEPQPLKNDEDSPTPDEIEKVLAKFGMTDKQRKAAEEDARKYLLDHKETIIGGLKSPDPQQRRLNISTIKTLGLKDTVPQLCEIAQNDPNVEVRASAIGALHRLGGKEVIPVMLKAIEGDDPWIRQSAAVKLVKLGRREGIAELIQIIEEADQERATKAYFALKEGTGKDFGSFFRRQDIPGEPLYVRDPDQMKAVFERCKKWWHDEGHAFEIPPIPKE